MKKYQILKVLGLVLLTIVFGYGDIYAQHLFSVNYNDLSQDKSNLIRTEIAGFNTSVSTMSMTKNRENKDIYIFSLSSVQNTKIIILNEETGNSVVITPVDGAPAQFELSPFFIEELRQAVLGDAVRYLVLETGANFSVINAVSISAARREVFIPTYFYGNKENVKEALPKERQIINIFKEKPKYIPAFPDDPENLRLIAELEEDMSYYVYMYQLPDGTLIIYDEHFNPVNPNAEKSEINTRAMTCCTNLQFNLSGNLTGQEKTATLYALSLWSAKLAGTVLIDINVTSLNKGSGVLGETFRQPHYWNPVTQTWYCSALGNQLAGYNVAPDMVDIRIEMNSNIGLGYSWHYPSTSNPSSSSEIDWITVILHEITHGLGFSRIVQSDGSYAYTTSSGIENTSTDYPGIYERQLYNSTGTNLPNLDQTQRASLVKSNNLYAGRPSSYLLTANGGNRVKMYAPFSWIRGSSVSHWDDSVTFSTFMKPSYDDKLHTFNALKIGILRDMGWEVPCPTVPVVVDLKGTVNNPIIISTDTTFRSCTNINIEYLKVQSGAKLTLEAAGKVNLGVGFKVELGSKLEIK